MAISEVQYDTGGFDVGADDTVVYSNGFSMFRLVGGDWQKIARANLIETLCVA